jgi:nucleoside-diphosphate-sugar epimerase
MTDAPNTGPQNPETTYGTTTITDEYMQEMLGKSRDYVVVILRTGPNYGPDARPTVIEHGRRNFALREEGLLSIVCRVTDESDCAGIGVFAAPIEEVVRIVDGDPGVQAGVFTYEIHPVRSFAGDALPG